MGSERAVEVAKFAMDSAEWLRREMAQRLAALRAEPSPESELGSPWREDEKADPNYGRTCVCGAAIRSGDRMRHFCEFTMPAQKPSPEPQRARPLPCPDDLEEHRKADYHQPGEDCPVAVRRATKEPQRASVSRDFVDRVCDRVGTFDFGDAKPEAVCNAVLEEAGAQPQRASAGLVEAVTAFVERLDSVHDDPCYQGVWTVAQIYRGPYQGPTYTDELAALREALAAEKARERILAKRSLGDGK